MSNRSFESSHELLDAQTHIWNQVYMFINSMSLKCAIQLGIPDIIHKHGKPMTLSQLTDALPIDKAKSHNIPRLMRILIHSKLFVKVNISDDDEEGYWLTPASRLLSRNEPFNLATFTLATLEPVLVDPCHHLAEWFQNDITTAFKTTHGVELFERAEREPGLNQLLNEMMTNDSRLASEVFVSNCKQVFDGVKTMVDVGGGQGTVARAIAEACPGLKCKVLDLPQVVAGLVRGNEDVTFVAGNMFDSIPHADAVLLKSVLHNWSDEECLKVLRNCKEAIPSKDGGGKVIIIDMVVDDQKQQEQDRVIQTQLCLDILMMAYLNGKERTEKEWANLFLDAGFTSYKITPALGLRSLIEVFP